MKKRVAQELSNSLNTSNETNTDNSQSNTQLVDKERYEGTGFDIVGNEEHGYFVALGNHRLTQPAPKEVAITHIKEKSWDLIFALAALVAERVYKDSEEKWISPAMQNEYGNKPKKGSDFLPKNNKQEQQQ